MTTKLIQHRLTDFTYTRFFEKLQNRKSIKIMKNLSDPETWTIFKKGKKCGSFSIIDMNYALDASMLDVGDGWTLYDDIALDFSRFLFHHK